MISYDVIECGQPLVKSERATPRPVGDQVLVRIEAAGVPYRYAVGLADLGL